MTLATDEFIRRFSSTRHCPTPHAMPQKSMEALYMDVPG
jgi:hypothetical protein